MNIKSITLFSLLIASFIFANPFASLANHDDTSIEFLKKASFKDIQDIAYEEDKPIFITFHATWSTPCKNIQTDVFENSKVAEYMNANFVNYSANIETRIGSALSEYFDIYHLPTVIIITPKGEIIMKNSSVTTPKKFIKWAKEAKTEYTTSKAKEDTGSTNLKKQKKAIAPAKCLRNKSIKETPEFSHATPALFKYTHETQLHTPRQERKENIPQQHSTQYLHFLFFLHFLFSLSHANRWC